MATDLAQLQARLAKPGGLKPIYLIQGTERLLVDEATRMVLAAAVDDPKDTLAVTRVDLAESGTGAREILGACRSLGLFAKRQAVVVRAADSVEKREADRTLLADYAKDPDPSTTLILVATKINGTLALVKRIKKTGEVLKFDSLKPWKVPDWLRGEARRIGHAMDRGTARLVADLAGTDLQRLRLIMDQLSLYVGPGNPIGMADAESLLVATRSHTVFELVDAVAERRVVHALQHLHAMMAHREPALRILAMLTRHFRLVWQAAELKANGATGPGAVQSALSVHEFVARKLWAQSERFHPDQLSRAYDQLYRTDVRLKSAGLDDATVMERLVLELCR